MSNAPRFDPPLVHALAAELGALLVGRAAHATPVFDADLSATLLLDRGEALRFDLHPARGWVRLLPRPAGLEGRPADARITRVLAPADERLLRIDLHEGSRFRGGTRALVLELHTNQWNALLVDGGDRRIVSVLRAREAGGRVLRAGEVYAPPTPQRRYAGELGETAARAEWHARLDALPVEERRGALLRGFAGASPLNVDALLATGDLGVAFARWWALLSGAGEGPVLLELRGALQPYPVALDGVGARPIGSLLQGFALAAEAAPRVEEAPASAALLGPARRRHEGALRRVERLRAEQTTVGEAQRLRRQADLLLANAARVQPGAERVTVYDEAGTRVRLRVDPALKPHENAERLYDLARRRGRAEERLPGLLRRAEEEQLRWAGALEALERGEVPGWVEAALARTAARTGGGGPQGEARLPYRVYRTSGGLEVRVGRSSRDNDLLTFRHARPDEVWMHARQVAGSHVVLRWSGEGAPPARDLEEAAALAAWHSKARSSGTVAVDWTRRKHVRKPRGAPPGRVAVSQAKTIFVTPLEKRVEEERG